MRARVTAWRASGESSTGRRSKTTSRRSASVRSLPLMCSACMDNPICSIGHSQLQRGAIPFRQRAKLHVAAGDDVHGFAFGEQRTVGSAAQLVGKMNHRATQIAQTSAHDQLFIVTYRRLVAAAGVHHGDEATI